MTRHTTLLFSGSYSPTALRGHDAAPQTAAAPLQTICGTLRYHSLVVGNRCCRQKPKEKAMPPFESAVEMGSIFRNYDSSVGKDLLPKRTGMVRGRKMVSPCRIKEELINTLLSKEPQNLELALYILFKWTPLQNRWDAARPVQHHLP